MTYMGFDILMFQVKNKTDRFIKESGMEDFNERDGNGHKMVATSEKGDNHHQTILPWFLWQIFMVAHYTSSFKQCGPH